MIDIQQKESLRGRRCTSQGRCLCFDKAWALKASIPSVEAVLHTYVDLLRVKFEEALLLEEFARLGISGGAREDDPGDTMPADKIMPRLTGYHNRLPDRVELPFQMLVAPYYIFKIQVSVEYVYLQSSQCLSGFFPGKVCKE